MTEAGQNEAGTKPTAQKTSKHASPRYALESLSGEQRDGEGTGRIVVDVVRPDFKSEAAAWEYAEEAKVKGRLRVIRVCGVREGGIIEQEPIYTLKAVKA